MSYTPAIPEGLSPLVDAVTDRLTSRMTRQMITGGMAPTSAQINIHRLGLRKIVVATVDAMIEEGYEVRKKQENTE